MTAKQWFPLAPLAAAMGLSDHATCRRLGLNAGRAAHRGISEYQADKLANRLGLHPAEIWRDWVKP